MTMNIISVKMVILVPLKLLTPRSKGVIVEVIRAEDCLMNVRLFILMV